MVPNVACREHVGILWSPISDAITATDFIELLILVFGIEAFSTKFPFMILMSRCAKSPYYFVFKITVHVFSTGCSF